MKVTTFFGTPMSVSPGGLAMDADRLINNVKALDGDKQKAIQFNLNSGSNSSALEHSVPEQMFSTPDNPAQGISAVKALQIANDQGIPIYTINQTNIASILPQLQLDSGTISDIQSAVNAGKIVTVSKTDIIYNGWTGCGYIIIDPNTGAGAYMISGGTNGAYALAAIASSLFVLTIILAASAIVLGGPAGIAAAAVAIGFFVLAMTVIYYEIAYLAGKETADEFFKCLIKLFIGDVFQDLGIHLIKDLLLKNVAKLASITSSVIEYVMCMEGLKE